jgi:ketosteroid isomerase-like protein
VTSHTEIVRRGYDAFNRGDVEGALADIHPEVEWHTYIVPGPGGGIYHGHDGVRELWAEAKRIFGDFRNVPEEVLPAGEKVLAYVCVEGVGTRSGAAVQARIAHVFTFREGRILTVRSYEDRDEARRAAGLST